MYEMTTKDRHYYRLSENGAILSTLGRGDIENPDDWRIVGFKRRLHSAQTISLAAAANGADTGQGWVVDIDHGTYRIWGSPSYRRLQSIRRAEVEQ